MNPIKALGWLVVLGIFSRSCVGDELATSSPSIIDPVPLTTVPEQMVTHGGVGVSGTNAVFVWNMPSNPPDGTTNLVLTRLDQSGRLVQESPEFVTSFYRSGQAQLLAARDGFFMDYFDSTNRLGRSRFMATRIGLDGQPAFAPVTISTNQFKASRIASDGRSFLLLVEDYLPSGISLIYTLIDHNGAVISRGVLTDEDSSHDFAVASDGTNYLAFWHSRLPPYQRGARIDGNDGSVATLDMGTNAFPLSSMRYGKNGYLLAGGQLVVQIDDNANVIARATNTVAPIGFNSIIYPEGDGWVVFTVDYNTGILRSLGVTPSPTGLNLKADLYPTVSGIQHGTYTPLLYSGVAPFGAGRFLVVKDNGVAVLTKTALSPVAYPMINVPQTDSSIVASPFGYLAQWTEQRGLGYSIRGLRFAPDGSPLDDDSFEIATFSTARTSPRSMVFDGKDYVVAWSVFNAPVNLARISPQGAPDVRPQSTSIIADVNGVYLIAQQGQLFACRGAQTLVAPDVHLWKIAADDQAGPEMVVHGYGVVSDGANLFSVGVSDNSDVYKITIDPAAANPEISSNNIAKAVNANIAPLQQGFAVQWFDSQGNSSFAYFSNGQERLRASAPTNSVIVFADNKERLLMVTLPRQGGRVTRFDTFNLQTAERASSEADIGNVTKLHAASAGADFMGVIDAFDFQKLYVANFWITTVKPPTFADPHIAQDNLTATLGLNPQRRYRVETSSDLLNWNFQQVVSGVPSFNVTLPAESQGFVRALLVPE